jgi:hypothetical protein
MKPIKREEGSINNKGDKFAPKYHLVRMVRDDSSGYIQAQISADKKGLQKPVSQWEKFMDDKLRHFVVPKGSFLILSRLPLSTGPAYFCTSFSLPHNKQSIAEMERDLSLDDLKSYVEFVNDILSQLFFSFGVAPCEICDSVDSHTFLTSQMLADLNLMMVMPVVPICQSRDCLATVEHRLRKTKKKMIQTTGGQTVEGCSYCDKVSSGKALPRCGKCRSVLYCNAECQLADWPSHKLKCGTPKN